jgi:hypothetical protein
MPPISTADRQKRLDAYFDRICKVLRNKCRRQAFAQYAVGLFSDIERKSVEPIAALVCADPTRCRAVTEKLLHFVGESDWNDRELRLCGVRYALEAMTQRDGIGSLRGSELSRVATSRQHRPSLLCFRRRGTLAGFSPQGPRGSKQRLARNRGLDVTLTIRSRRFVAALSRRSVVGYRAVLVVIVHTSRGSRTDALLNMVRQCDVSGRTTNSNSFAATKNRSSKKGSNVSMSSDVGPVAPRIVPSPRAGTALGQAPAVERVVVEHRHMAQLRQSASTNRSDDRRRQVEQCADAASEAAGGRPKLNPAEQLGQ